MIIRKIKIENIRGIEFREISVDVHPNTPTLFYTLDSLGMNFLQCCGLSAGKESSRFLSNNSAALFLLIRSSSRASSAELVSPDLFSSIILFSPVQYIFYPRLCRLRQSSYHRTFALQRCTLLFF